MTKETNKKLMPIESKFRSSIPIKSIRLVNQFAQTQKINGIIVSKDDFSRYDNALSIPASLFLTLI